MTGRKVWRGIEPWVPRVALLVLPAVWIALAVTLPVSAGRNLTVDVVCSSGNPVVGVWIESRSGGSSFARRGDERSAAFTRYTFRQEFSAPYQVRVGCGGDARQWGLPVESADSDRAYRRLLCEDADPVSARTVGCRDQRL
ncbi:hypothetical protein [Actinoplanes sp. RD1]|uniref:hypothetical protein n=1 Tax=Actinoplanes sp. RD1 TaxID=3064538 RepID=UPI002740446A|nr:hypothetical protein [Actinoplanes sp. RD1]